MECAACRCFQLPEIKCYLYVRFAENTLLQQHSSSSPNTSNSYVSSQIELLKVAFPATLALRDSLQNFGWCSVIFISLQIGNLGMPGVIFGGLWITRKITKFEKTPLLECSMEVIRSCALYACTLYDLLVCLFVCMFVCYGGWLRSCKSWFLITIFIREAGRVFLVCRDVWFLDIKQTFVNGKKW